MRRVAASAALVLAVLAGVALLVHHARSDDRYRVDVIFDVARGIGPRQVVKVAGAPVGTVTAVHLTPGYQARVSMRVDRRFAPFRADATCAIKPEGLISENFIDCSPGTAGKPALAPDASGRPTVPVAQTSQPVSLQDLFDIWQVPVRERLRVLLNELGAGVAGRSDDLQEILGRANPALASVRHAVALINRQRDDLVGIVDAARPVLGALATRRADVRRFLDRSAALTQTTAEHSDDLSQAIADLPPLLRSAAPALHSLDRTATASAPLLRELRGAAPDLTRTLRDVPAFSASSTRALGELTPSLRALRGALKPAAPVLRRLRAFATDADPAGQALSRLLISARDSGTLESLLKGAYFGAGLTNRYDVDGYTVTANIGMSQCSLYATTPVQGCSARLDGTDKGAPLQRDAPARHTAAAPAHAPTAARPTLPATVKVPTPTPSTVKPAAPSVPGIAGQATDTIKDLLDYLLG